VKIFASAAAEFKEIETYRTDRIDFVRQVLANKGDVVYQKMINAIKAKDQEAFKSSSAKFEQMIVLQDSLLSSNRYFTLNRWLQQALDFGTTAVDKANALKNAKAQITYWGPDTNPKTDLHEYAHKEWGGLLGSLYLERWRKFSRTRLAEMTDSPVPEPDYFQMEKSWAENPDLYVPKSISEKQLDDLINKILKLKV
jgi:alpha-N-acetylglucosaminidase